MDSTRAGQGGEAPRASQEDVALDRVTTESAFDPGTLEATLIDNAGDAVIVADATGIIRFWNPAAETMFGHSREQALGATLDLIIPEKLRGTHWDGYHRVMETGKTKYGGKTLSVPALRADGSRLSVSFTVSMLLDESGKPAGIGAIIRDVTTDWEDKKARQRKMAELKRELEAQRVRSGPQ